MNKRQQEIQQLSLALSPINSARIPKIEWQMKYSHKVPSTEMFQVTYSADFANIIKECYDENTVGYQEEFLLFCLNRSNKVVGFFSVSKGGITGTVADPRIIIKAALDCAATAIVLSHNHPSGSLKPSQADQDLTWKIKEAARYFDIQVLDHVIISDAGYYSFADEGLL
jgi:DNA repair protein RadC